MRALRRERQFTQETLAEQAGLSYKFIGEIERGLGNPTVDTLVALATALNVGVADLFTSAGDGSAVHPAPARYALSPPQLHAVREALVSIEAALPREDVMYRRRRRKSRP